jgi:hypothetical protein
MYQFRQSQWTMETPAFGNQVADVDANPSRSSVYAGCRARLQRKDREAASGVDGAHSAPPEIAIFEQRSSHS